MLIQSFALCRFKVVIWVSSSDLVSGEGWSAPFQMKMLSLFVIMIFTLGILVRFIVACSSMCSNPFALSS